MQLATEVKLPKGDSSSHQTLQGATLTQGQPIHSDSYTVTESYCIVNQPEGLTPPMEAPIALKIQLQQESAQTHRKHSWNTKLG